MSNNQNKKNQDSLNGIMLGVIFIIAGVLIYANEQNYIDNWFWWLVFSIGIVLLVEVFIRLNVAQYKKPIISPLIWGVVLVSFSSSQIYGFEDWWPLILVGVGSAIIFNSLKKQKA